MLSRYYVCIFLGPAKMRTTLFP